MIAATSTIMHCAPRDVAFVLISGAGLALIAEEEERERELVCASGWDLQA